tara:strand:- start:73 stop:396 length:324 start_codon:yes stop_codon:yes gene_type:complete
MGIEKKGVGEITLYTLPYCKHCTELKIELSSRDIPYKSINVDEHVLIGDWVEDNLKTDTYPVIHIEKSPENYLYLLSSTDLETLDNVRIFNTIDEALEILLKYYYEI